MKTINKIYINGAFTNPHGKEILPLFNPATGNPIGEVYLGDESDVNEAVKAAKRAFETFSKTSITERSDILVRLYEAMMAREYDLNAAAIEEYGSPITATKARTRFSAQLFLDAKEAMEKFTFETNLEQATIVNEPLGVIAAITPWNADYTHICSKLAPAIATGCTIVIKPSELSAIQTQILTECFNAANVPGVEDATGGIALVTGAANLTSLMRTATYQYQPVVNNVREVRYCCQVMDCNLSFQFC